MGFFTKSRPPEELTCREYLAVALPGPRTEALAISCIQQLADAPIAAPECYGDVLTPERLADGSAVVRDTMRQDRDLSAWVARKTMMTVNQLVRGDDASLELREGGESEVLVLALAAAGISDGVSPRITREPGVTGPSPDSQQAALNLAATALAVLRASLGTASPPEKALYEDLYTGHSGEDVEHKGYEISAWGAVLAGRLVNRGVPVMRFAERYRSVPRMERPGWYPNPAKTGEIIGGEAQFQRFWDGSAWTDRVRILKGREWSEHTLSLHGPPTG